MGAGLSLGSGGPDVVILDLDGTLYTGSVPIPGAIDAVSALKRVVPCRFLSNNGESTASALTVRLTEMGFAVNESEIITSANLVLVCLSFLRPHGKVLGLVSEDLAGLLSANGHVLTDDSDADFVVVGVDRQLSRRRLTSALRALLRGATLIATNEDPTYPASDGLRPAAGAYVGFFRGMGFEPQWLCGKPAAWAVQQALGMWGFSSRDRCLFVGDNVRTDMASAARVGAASALVLTGVSSAADAASAVTPPTLVVDDVAQLARRLCEGEAEWRGPHSTASASQLNPGEAGCAVPAPRGGQPSRGSNVWCDPVG